MIQLPVQDALNLFCESISVYDITFTLVLGRYERVQGPDRLVAGSIIPDGRITDLTVNGALSHGQMTLYTTDTIVIADATATTVENSQTYMRYNGEIWKLDAITNWQQKTDGIKRYAMTKYRDVDHKPA